MSDICANLWKKLNEYKSVVDTLKEKNLASTFMNSKDPKDIEIVLINIKHKLNELKSDFNDAKLVEGRIFWQDALIMESLDEISLGKNDKIEYTVRSNRIVEIYAFKRLLTQEHIDLITKLTNLETLTLSHDDLLEIDISELKALKNLKILRVNDCNLTQKHIDEISELIYLSKIILDNNDLSRIDISRLKNLKNIKNIHVYECNLTSEQKEFLRNNIPRGLLIL